MKHLLVFFLVIFSQNSFSKSEEKQLDWPNHIPISWTELKQFQSDSLIDESTLGLTECSHTDIANREPDRLVFQNILLANYVWEEYTTTSQKTCIRLNVPNQGLLSISDARTLLSASRGYGFREKGLLNGNIDQAWRFIYEHLGKNPGDIYRSIQPEYLMTKVQEKHRNLPPHIDSELLTLRKSKYESAIAPFSLTDKQNDRIRVITDNDDSRVTLTSGQDTFEILSLRVESSHATECINSRSDTTGTLISPRAVLTVGHAITTYNINLGKSCTFTKFRVKFPNKGWTLSSMTVGKTFITSAWETNPGETNNIPGTFSEDYALMILNGSALAPIYPPVNAFTLFASTNFVTAAFPDHIYSYGYPTDPDEFDILYRGFGSTDEDLSAEHGLIIHKADVTLGQSGGAVVNCYDLQDLTEACAIYGVNSSESASADVNLAKAFEDEELNQINQWLSQRFPNVDVDIVDPQWGFSTALNDALAPPVPFSALVEELAPQSELQQAANLSKVSPQSTAPLEDDLIWSSDIVGDFAQGGAVTMEQVRQHLPAGEHLITAKIDTDEHLGEEQVLVIIQGPKKEHFSATPNPCFIDSGNTCTTTLDWEVSDVPVSSHVKLTDSTNSIVKTGANSSLDKTLSLGDSQTYALKYDDGSVTLNFGEITVSAKQRYGSLVAQNPVCHAEQYRNNTCLISADWDVSAYDPVIVIPEAGITWSLGGGEPLNGEGQGTFNRRLGLGTYTLELRDRIGGGQPSILLDSATVQVVDIGDQYEEDDLHEIKRLWQANIYSSTAWYEAIPQLFYDTPQVHTMHKEDDLDFVWVIREPQTSTYKLKILNVAPNLRLDMDIYLNCDKNIIKWDHPSIEKRFLSGGRKVVLEWAHADTPPECRHFDPNPLHNPLYYVQIKRLSGPVGENQSYEIRHMSPFWDDYELDNSISDAVLYYDTQERDFADATDWVQFKPNVMGWNPQSAFKITTTNHSSTVKLCLTVYGSSISNIIKKRHCPRGQTPYELDIDAGLSIYHIKLERLGGAQVNTPYSINISPTTPPASKTFMGKPVLTYGYTHDNTQIDQYNVNPEQDKLYIFGNTWKAIDIRYTLTADTVLEFDYRSSGISSPEIAGIALDGDLALDEASFFQVDGTQTWGNQDAHNYSGSGWKTYRIPVGLIYGSGKYVRYLGFAGDLDNSNQSMSIEYRNVRFTEGLTDYTDHFEEDDTQATSSVFVGHPQHHTLTDSADWVQIYHGNIEELECLSIPQYVEVRFKLYDADTDICVDIISTGIDSPPQVCSNGLKHYSILNDYYFFSTQFESNCKTQFLKVSSSPSNSNLSDTRYTISDIYNPNTIDPPIDPDPTAVSGRDY